MVLRKLSEWLSAEEASTPPRLTEQEGAAGLLVAAAHRDGSYTDIERDLASAGLMKLFMIGHPEAASLRKEAEEAVAKSATFVPFAAAVRALPKDEQADLIRQLWVVSEANGAGAGENLLVSSVRDFLGFTSAEAEALRPVAE